MLNPLTMEPAVAENIKGRARSVMQVSMQLFCDATTSHSFHGSSNAH